MKLFMLIVGLPVLALIITAMLGIPALDYVAMFFDIVAKLFSGLAYVCRWLLRFLNLGIFN